MSEKINCIPSYFLKYESYFSMNIGWAEYTYAVFSYQIYHQLNNAMHSNILR